MAGLVGLLLSGAVLWWLPEVRAKFAESGPPVRVFGTVSERDVAEIRGRVRREIWRGILPRFDWWSITNLPTAVRSRAAQRIRGITAQPDGTVEVWTCEDVKIKGDIMFSHGLTFKLRKGQNGWQITERGWWDS